MGYFNYFIKCIIRNISYKLCKPKVLLTVLLSVAILFGLKHFGYCAEWDQTEINSVLDNLNGIVTDLKTNNSILYDIEDLTEQNKQQLVSIDTELNNISSILSNIETDTTNISSTLSSIISQIDTINTTLTEMSQQQNIFFEDMSSEIRTIRDALVGSDDTPVSLQLLDFIDASTGSGFTPGLRKYKIPMLKNYTYIIKVTYKNNESYAISVNYLLSSLNVSNGGVISDASLTYMGLVPANSSATFTIVAKDDTKPYLYLTYGYNDISISATGSIEGILDVLDRTNQQVVENIQQGNQLQQEQNQLQQEQNDFLKQEQSDSDVSVDSFDSVDSNDITSEGLTGVFTNIYNSISNWSSKDINLPIPYTNKSIVIPANYTHNMLSSFGGSWIISFISSIYYFIVARFIIYSITSIINSIKSGSILETDSKNNITTDML